MSSQKIYLYPVQGLYGAVIGGYLGHSFGTLGMVLGGIGLGTFSLLLHATIVIRRCGI